MRIVCRYVASIALGFCLVAGTTWAQSIKTIGGNPVVERQLVDNGATFTNFYLMDTNHPFANSGKLTHWEIYADGVNPVQLVIYRNQGGSFIEVGRSPLVTPVLGYNLFPLPPQPKITVEAGDFVGAYSPGPTGSISFSVEGSAASCDPYGATLVGFTPDSTTFACPVTRIYSLRAFRQEP